MLNKVYKRALFLFCPFLFLNISPGFAQNFDPQLIKAYQDVLDLRIRAIPSVLHYEGLSSDENKAFQVYIDNLKYVLELLLVNNENKFKDYLGTEKNRLHALEGLDDNLPFVAFMKIELKMHRGLLKIRYGEKFSGAVNLIQAFRQIDDFERSFPGYLYTLKTSGLLNVLLSLFPDQITWVLKILQVNPDIRKGISCLKELSHSNSVFNREGLLLYALSQSYYNDNADEIVKLLDTTKNQFNNSLLYSYLRGLISTKYRDNLKALEYFDTCLAFGREYLQVPLINYYRAECNLKKLNFNRAAYLYEVYLDKPDGDDYIKDSYYKLYNLAALYRVPDQNTDYYKNGLLSEGSRNTTSDNYAYNRIMNDYKPNKILFTSRILFDGGYYERSLDTLNTQSLDSFAGIEEISEYIYRLARNYQQLDEIDLAIKYFSDVIALENADNYYFWGNSLLHLGNIYSLKGELEKAREYYKAAISYSGQEYRNNIRMEAHTALKKLDDNVY